MTASPKIIAAAGGRPLHILGEKIVLKLTSADTAGQLALMEQINSPGSGIPPHVHSREDETFVLLEGQVEFIIGSVPQVLSAGDIVFAPRNVPHSFRVVSDTPARMLVSLVPGGLEGMLEEASKLPAGPPDASQIAALCERYGYAFV